MDNKLDWMNIQEIDPRKIHSYMRYLTKVYDEEIIWHTQTIRDAYRIRENDLSNMKKHGLITIKEETIGEKTKIYTTATKKLLDLPEYLFKKYRKTVIEADKRANYYAQEFEGRDIPRNWSPEE